MCRTSLKLLFVLLAVWPFAPSRVAHAAPEAAPPRYQVPASEAGTPLVFVVYGDTRFTERGEVVNAFARRALVAQIARENPAAILIGGDLVFEGSHPVDYDTYKGETLAWSDRKIPVFAALGNHEFKGCPDDVTPCLENWWKAAAPASLRPYRWYSVSIGSTLLALILDSDAALKPGSEQREWFERQIAGADERVKFILILLHYPPVRDSFYPSVLDEKEVARYGEWPFEIGLWVGKAATPNILGRKGDGRSDSARAKAYFDMARRTGAALSRRARDRSSVFPKIVVEES